MGSELRSEKLPLVEDLEKNARQFSFEMAAYILEYGSKTSFGKEINVFHAPFRTISINSFYLRATEIEKIQKDGRINTVYTERLSIAGLNSPLPTPYAELMSRRMSAQDIAMTSFINTFNSRLLGISYQISRRRYLCLQDHSVGNCMLVKTIATFSGEDPVRMNRKLSRLSYLFWTKEKSAAGLESLISATFQFETKVREFRPFWFDMDENNLLGKNLSLGLNAGLGKRALVSSFGIEIDVTHCDYKKILNIMTNEESLNFLKFLIRKYSGEFFSCYLCVTPREAPPLELKTPLDGGGTAIILGRTSWLPLSSESSEKMDCARINMR
jgi:type VI secretion system protein ImpH